ncbi:hypothetical protein MRX96_023576 [Rhipicephalus microplus]
MASAASSSGVKKHRALSLEIKECVIRDIEWPEEVKTCYVKNCLSEKSLQCLSFVEDEIVCSAVRKDRQTKITAFFR